tara:strand:- start:2024 stop:2656 length:633 start_codon:yes stop_codon:yes gene_type:complete
MNSNVGDPNVIILANGSFPTHSIPHGILRKAKYIICCDGAVNKLVNNNMNADKIIGDLDSINISLKKKYEKLILYNQDQNKNDLQKAIEFAINKNIAEVLILGATGIREDHTLANIFITLDYTNDIDCKIVTDHGTFHSLNKRTRFRSYCGQPISLFSTDPTIKITTSGLKYNLSCAAVSTLYKSSLNSAKSNRFSVDISHGSILVYQVH